MAGTYWVGGYHGRRGRDGTCLLDGVLIAVIDQQKKVQALSGQ